MRFVLTFAEYSVVNAVRTLQPPAVAMLMSAKVDGHRTWAIDAEERALVSLRDSLCREAAVASGTSPGSGMLTRVIQKIDELQKAG